MEDITFFPEIPDWLNIRKLMYFILLKDCKRKKRDFFSRNAEKKFDNI